jgi:hypothetical protein
MYASPQPQRRIQHIMRILIQAIFNLSAPRPRQLHLLINLHAHIIDVLSLQATLITLVSAFNCSSRTFPSTTPPSSYPSSAHSSIAGIAHRHSRPSCSACSCRDCPRKEGHLPHCLVDSQSISPNRIFLPYFSYRGETPLQESSWHHTLSVMSYLLIPSDIASEPLRDVAVS